MLNARSENFISEYFNENFSGLARSHVLLFGRVGLQHVESHRTLHVGGIENHHIFRAFLGDILENVFNEISMGIDHTNPVTVLNILAGHKTDERGFTGSSLSDDVVMPCTVAFRETDFVFHPTVHIVAQQNSFLG
ncbi:MAG: hypothetical protein ACD_28C00117G0001, partial [uncultured bacterium]